MSLQEAHQFIRALTEQFQLDNQAAATDNDLQTMELLQQTVQKTRELRRQQLDGCQQLLRELSRKQEQAKVKYQHQLAQRNPDAFLADLQRLEQQRCLVDKEFEQTQSQKTQLEQELKQLEQELTLLSQDCTQPELDEIGLRLKIYKSLGFDWQMDPQTQQFTKCRVRSADRSDVQTVSIDEQGAYSRFYLANKLWELCSQ